MTKIQFTVALSFMVASAFAWASPTATINTSEGKIVVELNKEKAPKTVANFISYAESGFYNKTIFHRVIPNFMIQGGGFTQRMDQKKTKAPIPIESRNGLGNYVGTIAMARTNDPNSATSQFFINLKDNDFLNQSKAQDGYGYTVFGKVIRGMDVVRKIGRAPTTSRGYYDDVPVRPIVIESVTITK